MGLVFLDAMNAAFTPDDVDPLRDRDAASGTVVAQQAVAASLMTVATSVVSINPHWGVAVLLGTACVAPLAVAALWRTSGVSGAA